MKGLKGRRVFRFVVPVDDRAHSHKLSSEPLKVARGYQAQEVVEFWVEDRDGAPTVERWFQVFGTGHVLPDDARWVGSCERSPDGLVWHLFEVTP